MIGINRSMRPSYIFKTSAWLRRPLHVAAILALVCLSISGIAVSSRHLAPVEAQPAATPVDPWPRPANIIAGDCAVPGAIAWPLNALASPDGIAEGSTDSDRTEYSFTSNVPMTIQALLAGRYAIQVHESSREPEHILACGNIGGVLDSIGQLVVGLRWQSPLDISGIAVLSPSPSDPTRTLVSIFISGEALGHETGTWAEPTGEAPTTVPDGETPVNPEPTEPRAQPTEVESEPTEVDVEPTRDDDDGDDGDGHDGDDGSDNSGPGGGGGDDNSGPGG